ncbi:hypothetical protein [Streptomyces sp. NPDC000229]|uniref:hypothetical protein n=1 Tax=Streptomyces sp. NPDC000229 TaxID=3154247 RepID=UPI0033322AD5
MDGVSAYGLDLRPEYRSRVGRQVLVALVPTALFTAFGAWAAGDLSVGWLLVCAALAFGLSVLALVLLHGRSGRLRVDAHGITGGNGELVPWDNIRFVVLHDRLLQVRLHRHTSSHPLVTVHNDGYGLGRERHAERRRAVVAAVEHFAPGRYVADRQRVLRELER